MKSIQYSIVDVFAQRKYTGNQLAVFKDAESLSDKEMQQMAKEINFSETTFITSSSPQKGEYNVRISLLMKKYHLQAIRRLVPLM